MIWITRIDGERVLLNDDQILFVEATHDTLLVLANGERVRVLESPEELVDRIARWRQRSLGLSFFHDDEAPAR
ncbi:flagellar FlbD family protein [Myxococcota bacterium]|nr:flagellar FlbD family protein [Myxococcota bacterium]